MRIVLIYLLILLLEKKIEVKCQATVVYFFFKFFKENLIVISKVQFSGMGSHECLVSVEQCGSVDSTMKCCQFW